MCPVRSYVRFGARQPRVQQRKHPLPPPPPSFAASPLSAPTCGQHFNDTKLNNPCGMGLVPAKDDKKCHGHECTDEECCEGELRLPGVSRAPPFALVGDEHTPEVIHRARGMTFFL